MIADNAVQGSVYLHCIIILKIFSQCTRSNSLQNLITLESDIWYLDFSF